MAHRIAVGALLRGDRVLLAHRVPGRRAFAILDVWVVRAWRGEPMNAAEDEHDELRWVDLDALLRLDLAHEAYGAFFRDLLTAGA